MTPVKGTPISTCTIPGNMREEILQRNTNINKADPATSNFKIIAQIEVKLITEIERYEEIMINIAKTVKKIHMQDGWEDEIPHPLCSQIASFEAPHTALMENMKDRLFSINNNLENISEKLNDLI